MLELQNFIAKYQQLSKYRGVDPTNPVDFQIQPFGDGRSWTLICSFSEPTFARIPYNVLWMPVDGGLNPAKIYRRYDHETSTAPFAAAWTEITAYADLWTEEQYYDPVLDNLNSYDIIDPYGALPIATDVEQGLTRLAPNPDNAPVSNVAIETTDERMDNPRYPNEHDHPDYPRSLIKINETQWARVNHSFPPSEGMLLFIEGESPNDPNEFIAVWRYPHERDVGLVDRSLLYIEVRGDTSMLEQTSKTYTVWGVFADGVSRQVDPVTFEVTQNQDAVESFNSDTGVLTAANIIDNETVRLEASYTFRGITRTAFRDVQIIAGAELVALRIVGADSIQSPNDEFYSFEAEFSDGSVVGVTPATFTSSNTALTSIGSGSSRVNTVETLVNDSTTLEASYTYDGTTLTATKEVQILAKPDYPITLEILGPTTLTEGETYTYTFRVTMASGDIQIRESVTLFRSSLTNEPRLSFNVSDVTVLTINSNGTATLFASLNEADSYVTANLSVNLVNVSFPTALSVVSNNSANLQSLDSRARYVFDNGDVLNISEPAVVQWTVSEGSQFVNETLMDAPTNRVLRVEGIPTEVWPFHRPVTVTAQTEHPDHPGIPLQGSRTVYVKTIGKTNMKLVPVGEDPATWVMPDNNNRPQHQVGDVLRFNLWYLVNNTWVRHIPQAQPSIPLDWGRENSNQFSVNHSGVGSAFDINTVGFIQSYESIPEEIVVTVLNPASNTNAIVDFRYRHNTINGSLTDASDHRGYYYFEVLHVAAPVTVEELRIRVDGGPDANASTHAEDQTLTLRYEARFSDAPAAWVDVTNRVGSGLTATVRAPANGVTLAANLVDLTLPDVTGNQTSIVDATFVDNGVTRNASYTVTITDENAPVLPTALRIRVVGGPNANASSHNENTSITLRYEATYADAPSTWVDVTNSPGLTASLTAPLHGSVLTGRTDLALGEAVEGNKTLAITASLTDAGTTVNAGYTVTIVDTTVYLNAIRVRLASAPNAATNSSTVNENQTVGLVYQAEYTDAPGTWVTISASNADLTVNLNPNSAGATLNAGRDQLTLPDVTGNQSVTVNASFTSGGRTRAGTYVLNVTDATVYLTAFRIRLASAPNATTNTSTHNENQTIAVVYQAQFSDAPTTWVDVSSNSLVTGAIVAPANGVTLSSKTNVVLPDVTGNQTVTLRGTFAHPTGTQTADYIFNITDIVVTPLELRVRLASAPTAPTNSSTHDENQSIEMIYQARFSNNISTWVNVNTHPGLNVSVASPAHGVTLNANKTTVNLPDVDGNKTVTLNASLVQNGTTVNASYTVNIVDNTVPAGITPRWGVAPQVQFRADYATPAFYDQLTGSLTGVSGQQITATTVSNMTSLCYVMYPASWGFLYVVNQSNQAGAFDGAGTSAQDAVFNPAELVTVGGVDYYVYRQSFPFNGTRTYTLTYGSSAAGSGVP